MNSEKKDKLERYFRNSHKFLWGLSRRPQQETYRWLYDKGFKTDAGTEYKGSYDQVAAQLVNKYKMERILRGLVVPEVNKQYHEKAIEFMRNCWMKYVLPQYSILGINHIDDKNAYPFLEINSQYKSVERWGEFAGLWFEEIDPLQY